MPVFRSETETLPQIADEFGKIATVLRSWPPGTSGSTRGAAPSRAILASLRKVNGTLAEAANKGSITPAAFTAIGGEFGKIGAALQAVGTPPKTKARKATKKRTRR